MSGLVNQTSAYVAGGVVPGRMGNAHVSLFPYEPLPTADGDLIIAAGNDTQFRRLCEVLGAPELADDERFARTGDRTENREALRPLLVEKLKERTSAEWFEALNKVGVPNGPINTVGEGVEYAAKLGLEPVVKVGHGDDAVDGVRHPLSFSAAAPRYDRPPPALDADGDEVRAWLATRREQAGKLPEEGS